MSNSRHPILCVILGVVMFLVLGLQINGEPTQDANSDAASHETTDTDPALLAEVQQLAELTAELKDLDAHFRQEKMTALLKKPLVSTGRVLIIGDRSRWDTDKPYHSVTLIDASTLRIYDPEAKVLEVYPLDGRMREMMLSPMPRVQELAERFVIRRIDSHKAQDAETDAEDLLSVSLTPKDETLAQHVQEIVVRIDRKTGLAAEVSWTDADHEQTRLIFLKAKANTGLKPDAVELTVPDDVTVSYPMGGGPESEEQPASDEADDG